MYSLKNWPCTRLPLKKLQTGCECALFGSKPVTLLKKKERKKERGHFDFIHRFNLMSAM